MEYGFRPVKLPDRDEQLYLVVVKGFGAEPLLLLTADGISVLLSKLGRWTTLNLHQTHELNTDQLVLSGIKKRRESN